jgi:hypothetical protein
MFWFSFVSVILKKCLFKGLHELGMLLLERRVKGLVGIKRERERVVE